MALRYRIAHTVCRALAVEPPPCSTDQVPPPLRLRQRLRAALGRLRTLTASYGSSIAAHAGLLGVLALITIALPSEQRPAEIHVRAAAPRPSPPLAPRNAHDSAPTLLEDPRERLVPAFESEDPVPVAPGAATPRAALATAPQPQPNTQVRPLELGLGRAPLLGAYSRRGSKSSLRREGGGAHTEAAVRAALAWLARHQDADGGWRVSGWTDHCDGERCAGPGHDTGWASYDESHHVGVSALALLACLGNGHTQRSGTFKNTVHRAVNYLKRSQAKDGSIGFRPDQPHTIYDHALATLALCESYALSRDFTLRRPAQRALDFAVAAQNPDAGWRYGIRNGQSDTSVTGWYGLALEAGRKAGLEVPPEATKGMLTWFRQVTERDGEVGYSSKGSGSVSFGPNVGAFDDLPVNTAVATACRLLSGKTRTRGLGASLARISEHPPRWERSSLNFYYWYYGSYALFQAGGERWQAWNEAMQEALLPHQRSDDCARGSWDAVGEWCLIGGRVYATAINALTLEIYYRYERR